MLMRYIVCRALKNAGADVDFRRRSQQMRCQALGDIGLLSATMIPSTCCEMASGLVDSIGDVPLAHACGSMSSFVTDPSWHEFRERLRKGLIAPTDKEWAFS